MTLADYRDRLRSLALEYQRDGEKSVWSARVASIRKRERAHGSK
jgi:hypothetical protein